MQKLILVLLLLTTMGLHAQTFVPQDSLILEVGAEARVLFLAKRSSSFDEIAKYDLNLVYRKLVEQLRRSDQSNVRRFSEEEALQYKSDDPALLPEFDRKKFWKRLYLNFFVGASNLEREAVRLSGRIERPTVYRNMRTSWGLSINMDVPVFFSPRKQLDLRTSFGFDIIQFDDDRIVFTVPSLEKWEEFNYLNYSTSSKPVSLNQLYLQLQPMFTVKSRKATPLLKVGIGIRGGLDLRNNNRYEDDSIVFRDSDLRLDFGKSRIDRLQYGLVATVGYRFLSLYGTYLPGSHRYIPGEYWAEDMTKPQTTMSVWSVGIRLGK